MANAPSIEEFLAFAQCRSGENIRTAGGRAFFMVEVTREGLRYTPVSSGKPRNQKRQRIGQILDHYRRSGSLTPVDYQFLTFHSSYAIGILKLYLEHAAQTSRIGV